MIYLIGASGHAKVIIEILERLGLEIGGLMDANSSITSLLDYRCGTAFPLAFDADKDMVILSIGNNSTRKHLASKEDFRYATAVHPDSTISPRSQLGEGTVVMAGVRVNAEVQVGKHAILNTNCTIDHDCVLEDYVHISPNVALAGGVTIGEGTHIGIGACIIPGVKIGKWCTVGAGAVVIKDIPDYAVVVGNPAKVIKYNAPL